MTCYRANGTAVTTMRSGRQVKCEVTLIWSATAPLEVTVIVDTEWKGLGYRWVSDLPRDTIIGACTGPPVQVGGLRLECTPARVFLTNRYGSVVTFDKALLLFVLDEAELALPSGAEEEDAVVAEELEMFLTEVMEEGSTQ